MALLKALVWKVFIVHISIYLPIYMPIYIEWGASWWSAGGGSKFFRRCGVWRSFYLFLKKPITLIIFRGSGSWSPDPHLSVDSEIKRIGKNDRCSPNKRLFDKGCRLISLIVLMFSSGQNSSITKVNNFWIMQKRVMVLVHCISPHPAISTIEVSSWYLLYM